MDALGIQIERTPQVKAPVFITGFNGWGNALNVSTDMIDYLVEQLGAERFGRLDPDWFFIYENARPSIDIRDGVLKRFEPPEGTFYAVRTDVGQSDLVLFKSHEPTMNWYRFCDALFELFLNLKGRLFITLGGMYDNVLHTDRELSGMAAGEAFRQRLIESKVTLISYQGPGAVHTILQVEGTRLGIECISLWAHCPYYLQGTSHFGLLAEMGDLLSQLANFRFDPSDLEKRWQPMAAQIQRLIDEKPDLRDMINKLRKEKTRGSATGSLTGIKKGEKVIDISDFLNPK
jgi:proteasome assembly chaperone (PAC2) family protein